MSDESSPTGIDFVEPILERLLAHYDLSLKDSRKIATAVLQMSDFYIQNPLEQTPWSENWAQVAQLCYYWPLNLLRSQRVFKEAKRLVFHQKFSRLLDFGSGLGAGSWWWAQDQDWQELIFHEQSPAAAHLHKKSLSVNSRNSQVIQWSSLPKQKNFQDVLAVFSYSLTELGRVPDWLFSCGGLILIEPSTQDDGRKLMELRKNLIDKNFSIWAPCLHQESCPLLTESKNDWCHDRAHTNLPEWFRQIENHLPMQNRTVTFSYLLASQEKAPVSPKNWGRLVGDLREEKGKSRQLICRGPQREFLTWLHRHGKPTELYRGDLAEIPENASIVANEIRLNGNS